MAPFSESVSVANSKITGSVHIMTNSRMHQWHQVILADGNACNSASVSFQVKLCSFEPSTRRLKKGTALGLSDRYDGPDIAMVNVLSQALPDNARPQYRVWTR